jgi:hypothetical protein
MSQFTDFCGKYGVLILAVVVLLLAIAAVAYKKERFVQCSMQAADIIEGDLQLTVDDKMKLLGKCAATGRTKENPNGVLPPMGDKFTQAQVDSQEMTCMTSCYPGMYTDIHGQPTKVCVDECKVPTSLDCQQCVTQFHCIQSEGGNSGMPCQSQSIVIDADDQDQIDAMVAYETS